MFAHITRRLIYMLIVLFVMTGIVFFLMSIFTGDPVLIMLGESADKETIATLREQLGLSRPIAIQYIDWLSHVVRGDLGNSYTMPMTTVQLIRQRLPATLELTILSMIFSLLCAIPLGIVAAVKFNSKTDLTLMGLSSVCISMPNFWIGILLILLLSLKFNLLPASGYVPFFSNPLQNLKLMILPVVTLSVWYIAVYMRFIRSSFIETLQSEYILVARAKGLMKKRVLRVHAFKNALIPLVTVVGVNISGLLGGAVVTEVVFGIPGIGRLLVDAILGRDLPLMEGIILFTTMAVILCNLVVDILYVYIDPRIRYD